LDAVVWPGFRTVMEAVPFRAVFAAGTVAGSCELEGRQRGAAQVLDRCAERAIRDAVEREVHALRGRLARAVDGQRKVRPARRDGRRHQRLVDERDGIALAKGRNCSERQ